MSEATIRAEVKSLIETVANIGNVHDYVRSTYFWSQFFTEHQDGSKILTWEITRKSTSEELWTSGGVEDNYKDTHSFMIIGRMSLADELETEKDFQNLASEVQKKFREDADLNGTILPIKPPNLMQIKSVGHASYAGVLVHEAVLTIDLTERVGG